LDLQKKNKEEAVISSAEEIENLTYFIAAIKESQRFYPIAPYPAPRCSLEDTQLGGYFIPKGTISLISFIYLFNSEEYWREPRKFRPERFISDSEWFEKSSVNPWIFNPFGQGPRSCIGENLAWRETIVILATFLHRYDFELSDKNWKYEPEQKLALRPKGGILDVFVKLRSQ